MSWLQALGGLMSFNDNRKAYDRERDQARQYSQEYQNRLTGMEDTIGLYDQNTAGVQQMYDTRSGQYGAADQQLYNLANISPEMAAQRAASGFDSRYDANLAANERALMARGVDPSSSQYANMRENAAMNRALGSTQIYNATRDQAQDRSFARNLAYANRGDQLRQELMRQYAGSFGMQGQVASDYQQLLNGAQQRQQDASAGMAQAGAAVGQAFGGMVENGIGGLGVLSGLGIF